MNPRTVAGLAGLALVGIAVGALIYNGEAQADKTVTLTTSLTDVKAVNIVYGTQTSATICADIKDADGGAIYSKCDFAVLSGAALTKANDIKTLATGFFNQLEGL